MDDPARNPAPGDPVGLGRVVDNPSNLGRGEASRIQETSEDSFPASDAPGFTGAPATPVDPDRVEAPARRVSDRPSA